MSREAKKTITPKLRFSEFKQSGEWEENTLEGISPAIFDGTHQTPKYVESGIPFFSVENLISENKNKYISREDYLLATSRNKPEKGDILITRIGNIGFSKVIDWDYEFSIYVTLAVIKKSNKFNSYYLSGYLQSPIGQNEIKSKSLLNAVPCKINMNELRSVKVLLPKDKTEQLKIAECLSSLDELITAQGEKIETLKIYKKSLILQLFPQDGETVPRLRFPEFKNGGDWEEKTLKDVCQMQAGKFVSASDIMPNPANNLFPCYGGNGLRGYTKTFTHSGEYSLIGRQGALCGNVKFATGNFHATEHAVVVTPKLDIVDNKWLYHVLVFLNLNQYATGQAQPGLSVENLSNVKIVLPSQKSEQRRIAECILSLDELITAQVNELEVLKLHKKGLLQQIFPASMDGKNE